MIIKNLKGESLLSHPILL